MRGWPRVGSPSSNHAGFAAAGAAYVFVRKAEVWSEDCIVVASDASPYAELGTSVGFSGNTLLVGAPYASQDGLDGAGAVYAFLVAQPLGSSCAQETECLSKHCVEAGGSPGLFLAR
jgi:hypothetical protein